MTALSDCPRQGRWFGGCCFEARYDKSAPDLPRYKHIKCNPGATTEFLDGHRTVTYVRDVCVRCGRTIERQP